MKRVFRKDTVADYELQRVVDHEWNKLWHNKNKEYKEKSNGCQKNKMMF